MNVMVNCGACPDLHREEADGVILVRKEGDGGMQCPSFVHGEVVLVMIRWPDGTLQASMPKKMKDSEIELLPRIASHLASHHG